MTISSLINGQWTVPQSGAPITQQQLGTGGSSVYSLTNGNVFQQADGSYGRTYDPTNPNTAPRQPSAQFLTNQTLRNQIRQASAQLNQAGVGVPKIKFGGNMQAGGQFMPGNNATLQALYGQIMRMGGTPQYTPRQTTPFDPANNIYMQNGSPMTMVQGQNGQFVKSYGSPMTLANPNPTIVPFNRFAPSFTTPATMPYAPMNPAANINPGVNNYVNPFPNAKPL